MLQNEYDFILKCPQCYLETGLSFNFGKKGRCCNCSHIWDLKWKGGKKFSFVIRNQYK